MLLYKNQQKFSINEKKVDWIVNKCQFAYTTDIYPDPSTNIKILKNLQKIYAFHQFISCLATNPTYPYFYYYKNDNKKSDDKMNINKYRVTANFLKYHIISKLFHVEDKFQKSTCLK